MLLKSHLDVQQSRLWTLSKLKDKEEMFVFLRLTPRKLLSTELTLVALLVRVYGRYVVVEVGVLAEIFAAFFALERLLA